MLSGVQKNERPIYLDFNATTSIAPEVAEAISPYLHEEYGNPSSSHVYGRHAREAIGTSRKRVAALIGASEEEILFTGCATEANNLALLGVAQSEPEKRHIIISAVEHPAVAQPAAALARQGWRLTVLPVDAYGRVSADSVKNAIRPDTALVSVMHANNEVGTIQPIEEIAAITRACAVLLHVDAAQSIGKVPVNVGALGADLLTLAGHKFYAPKGVGALYVRTGVRLRSVTYGADHERGLRPGTENVIGIVGLGAAAQMAQRALTEGSESRLRQTRDLLHSELQHAIPGLVLNGHPEHRLSNTLHVSFPGVSGKELLAAASETVAASVGSACHSEGDAVSGVLAAMGVGIELARGAVRLSVGLPTSEADVRRAASALVRAYQHMRSHS